MVGLGSPEVEQDSPGAEQDSSGLEQDSPEVEAGLTWLAWACLAGLGFGWAELALVGLGLPGWAGLVGLGLLAWVGLAWLGWACLVGLACWIGLGWACRSVGLC